MSWRDAPIVDAATAQQPMTRRERFMMGLGDPVIGAEQLLSRMVPDPLREAINRADVALSERTGGVLGRGVDPDQFARMREEEYQTRRQASGETGIDAMRIAGNVLNPINLAPARLPIAATAAGRLAQGGAIGGAYGAIQPVIGDQPEEFWGEKAMQTGVGAALGGVGDVAIGPIARGAQRAQSPDIQLLQREGVRPTAAQIMGEGAKSAEEMLRSFPALGGAITSSQRQAMTDFNSAAINRAVAPIGGRVDSVGLEGATAAARQLDDAYDAARAMVKNGIPLDQTFASQISAAQQAGLGLTDVMQKKLDGVINRSLGQRIKNQGISADDYKKIDSELRTEIMRFRKSPDPTHQEYAEVLMDVQSALRDQLFRTNQQASQAFRAADEGYRHLTILERAADRAAPNDGIFTPNQLLMMARQADDRVRNRGIIEGTATYADLALAGQRVIGSRYPDSGTAGRLGLGMALGGGSVGMLTAPNSTLMAGAGLGGLTGAYMAMNPALRSLMIDPRTSGLLQSAPAVTAAGGGSLGGAGYARGLLEN